MDKKILRYIVIVGLTIGFIPPPSCVAVNYDLCQDICKQMHENQDKNPDNNTVRKMYDACTRWASRALQDIRIRTTKELEGIVKTWTDNEEEDGCITRCGNILLEKVCDKDKTPD